MLQITTEAGTADAYLARPDEDTSRPGVLMYMDAIGVRPQTKAIADRIADWGYVVLLPNVFYREGPAEDLAPAADLRDPDNRAAFMKVSMPRVHAYTPDKSNADLPFFLDTLAEYATAPFGTVGFCMGARLVIRAAAGRPEQVRAAAGFHGADLVEEGASDSPHLLVADSQAAYLFGHADNDQFNPPEAQAELHRRIEDAGLEVQADVYPDAPHGFTMKDTSSYQEAGAERAFAELRDFFDRTLRG